MQNDINNKVYWILYYIIGPAIFKKLYPNTNSSMWCFLGPAITFSIQIFKIFQ